MVEAVRGATTDPASPPLPQGAASEINDALAEVPEGDEVPETEDNIEGGEEPFALADDLDDVLLEEPDLFDDPGEEDLTPGNEVEGVLAEAGTAPELFASNLSRPPILPPPPEGAIEWLPVLARLASDPNAPDGVKILYRTMIDALYPPRARG